MERNRLTLVAPEDAATVPSDGAPKPPLALPTQDCGAPVVQLARVDDGSVPDDAA
jgi:hypothetical protein